jgi:MoxR-like ATPase
VETTPVTPRTDAVAVGRLWVRLRDAVAVAVVDAERAARLLAVALLADGHALIEDVPGVGKTVLAKAFSRALGLGFARVQGTPDLLPGDVTGSSVLQAGEFRFVPGPIFTNVLLVDEINRATPRTQAALLEAMQEGQVTTGGVTRKLPTPFLVLATQNPIEYEGTFPLPEAQLDRFLMRMSLGYPAEADEIAILRNQRKQHPIETLGQAVNGADLLALHDDVTEVHVDATLEKYILAIVQATRTHPDVALGASPRGSLALYKTAQALAALRGRDYAIPDDIKTLTQLTLAHRLLIKPESQLRGRTAKSILSEILERATLTLEEGA